MTRAITKLTTVVMVLFLDAACAFGAPQQGQMVRIGLLWPLPASAAVPSQEAFVEGLRDLGWFEGRNLVIERRFADGRPHRLPGLAAELVARNVDMIVTGSTPGALAAKQATRTIPIVVVMTGDPVVSGVTTSLSRPDGNVTGITAMRSARTAAFIVQPDILLDSYRRQIIELAARNRLPGMYPFREHVEAGGPMFYGANIATMWNRAAAYVDSPLTCPSSSQQPSSS